MIILRYLSKQILQMTASISFVLLVVVVLGRFLTYLSQASQGELEPSVLALLMTYRVPEFLQLILPLSLLMGILLAYGRMYADSEMTVLIACGLSKSRLFALTLFSSSLVALIIAVLALKVTPWGLNNTATLLESQEELTEFDIMVPGIFLNFGQGERTSYAQNIVEDEMQNVFMYETEINRVTVADFAAPIEDEQGRRFILFNDGSVSEGLSGENAYTLTQFVELGIRLPDRELDFQVDFEEEAMPTLALFASSDKAHIAELQWRISLIIIIPILSLLAVPLSKVSPRQGQFASLLPATLIYILYFGLLLGGRDLVASGFLPPILGLWWVHLLFIGVGLILFFEKLQPLLEGSKTRPNRVNNSTKSEG